jgi:hypothetical protein
VAGVMCVKKWWAENKWEISTKLSIVSNLKISKEHTGLETKASGKSTEFTKLVHGLYPYFKSINK